MTTVPALPLADVAMPSLLTGALGIVLVFAVLVLLSVAARVARRKAQAEPEIEAAPPVAAPVAAAVAAPAVAEPVRLIGVEEKEAAMIMAILCDELQAPPEELYFKSIRLMDADATH